MIFTVIAGLSLPLPHELIQRAEFGKMDMDIFVMMVKMDPE